MTEGEKSGLVTGQRDISEEKRQVALSMRRVMTPTERRLWERLRRSALGAPFRRQQILFGYIADFYCHPLRLVVEIDGAFHDADYDTARDQRLRENGIVTLRFSAEMVEQRIGVVLAAIRAKMRERGSERQGQENSPPSGEKPD